MFFLYVTHLSYIGLFFHYEMFIIHVVPRAKNKTRMVAVGLAYQQWNTAVHSMCVYGYTDLIISGTKPTTA